LGFIGVFIWWNI